MSYQWQVPDNPVPPPVGFVCAGCGWHSLDDTPPRGCKYCDGNGSNILCTSDRMQPTTAEDMAPCIFTAPKT